MRPLFLRRSLCSLSLRSSPWLLWLAVAVALALALAACSVEGVTFTSPEPPVEDCAAPGDEDGNGQADCADPACTSAPACQAACGNDKIETGEGCDDGNLVDGDGCDNNCTVTGCGNDVMTDGEGCDDGNLVTETCPYGSMTSCTVCDATCQMADGALSYCGDDFTDAAHETCDDGNTTTEACAYGETSCTVCNATCQSVAGATSFCGNGSTDPAHEGCDDGNTTTEACMYGQTSCTVCSATCQSVAGATSFCGNGSTDPANETCDDGNTTTEVCAYGQTSCTVCNSICQSAAGATSYCGDSATDPTRETCDDGNATTEACTYGQTSCTVCNSTCQSAAGATSYCGNGSTDPAHETCDDGNTMTEVCTYGQTSCTVCNSTCQSAAGATSYCGNGSTDPAHEACDDGNTSNTDACLNSCVNATCGDGHVRAGVETCDDGNTTTEACTYGQTSCTVCNATCQSAAGETSYCGDGTRDSPQEECDDGNDTDGDACDNDCTFPDSQVPSDPVVWLKFDDPPADGVLDSGAGHTVVCAGTCPGQGPGVDGGAYRFGTGIRVDVQAAPDLGPGSAFTIAAWVRLDSGLSSNAVIGCKNVGNGDCTYGLLVSASGVPLFHSSGSPQTPAPVAIGIGDWHHVAMTWNGTRRVGYLDGVNVSDLSVPFMSNSDTSLSIGARFHPVPFSFSGSIDQFLFYNRALTAAEIAQLATP